MMNNYTVVWNGALHAEALRAQQQPRPPARAPQIVTRHGTKADVMVFLHTVADATMPEIATGIGDDPLDRDAIQRVNRALFVLRASGHVEIAEREMIGRNGRVSRTYRAVRK